MTGEPAVGGDCIEEVVPLRGGEICLLRPRESESLITEEAFEREEFLPYWAELWSSSVALAGELAGRALRGARVLELGCGLGLPSIVAARAGGRVLATDWSQDAVAMTGLNAERNGVELRTATCSWSEPDAVVAESPWDLVLASDVLYERRNVALLLRLLQRLVDEHGEIWLSDPGRPAEGAFLEGADGSFTCQSRASGAAPRVTIHRLRRTRSG